MSSVDLQDRGSAARPKSLFIQAGWLIIARVVGFAFTFLIPIVLSRVLDLKHFGLYKQAFLVVATSQSILPLGFGMSTFYFLSREHEPGRRASVVANALLFHLLVAAVAATVMLLWPGILVHIFGSAELVPYAPAIAGVLLLSIFSYLIEFIATANQDVMFSTVFIIMAQMTKSIAMLTAALWTHSIQGLLYAAMLQGTLQSITLLYYVRLRFPGFWRSFSASMMGTQFAYTLPLGLAGLIFTLQNDLHNYFVSNAYGPATFAIYSVAVAQLPLIGVLRESINAVLLGRISSLQKEGRAREILGLSMQVMRKLALCYWPLYGFLMVVAREFILTLYTDRFISSVPMFRINLTLLVFMIVVLDPILRAYAEHRYYLLGLRIVLVTVLVTILTTSLRTIGLTGAVTTVVGLSLIERMLILWKTSRILGFTRADARQLRVLGRIAAMVAVSALAAVVVHALVVNTVKPIATVALTGAVFSLTYAALIFRSGILEADERNMLQRQWDRALRLVPGR